MPLLHQGAPNCSQYSRWGCTGKCRVRSSSLADPLLHPALCSVCLEVGRAWWGFAGQVLSCLMVCFSINVKRVSLHVSFQLEVSQLEGSLQQPKAQSAMSPYLVPDTQALCQHLALVKQLATSGRFIIIIPRTGMGTPEQVTGTGCPFCAGSRHQGPGWWLSLLLLLSFTSSGTVATPF